MSYPIGGYTRNEVLDKLIAAGLGDVEQHHITQDEYRRAMAGEVVIAPRVKAPERERAICPTCKAEKENRSWSYCRACTAVNRKNNPSRWQKRKKKKAFLIGLYHPDSIR
jgi:hypothetical protein